MKFQLRLLGALLLAGLALFGLELFDLALPATLPMVQAAHLPAVTPVSSTFPIIGADSYEPDNDCTTASHVTLEPGDQVHSLHIVSDTDWISFTAQAGQTYTIRTKNLSSQDPLSLSLHYLCGSATGGRDCRNILTSPGFEGTAAEVFQFWKAGPAGAYQRNAAYAHSGSFSMRLHASLGNYPCNENVLQPYLYQTITLPHGIPEGTRLTLAGRYLVTGSTLMCSNPNQPDADDALSFDLRTLTGISVLSGTPPQPILNGGAPTETWHYRTAALNDYLDLQAYAGQPLNLFWNGFNDGDTNGTFFYLDDLEAQLCVPSLPIPDELVWMAPESGPYYLQVGIAPEHFVSETLYMLSVSQPDPYEPDNDCATASPIAVDTEVQTHTLHLGEDTDWITFTARAGEHFEINYSTSPMSLPVGVWVGHSCLEPKAGDPFPSEDSIQWVAQQDGVNYIRIKATNPAEVSPNARYTLSVHKVDPFPGDDTCTEARPITTDGRSQTMTLFDLTDTDWISFTAQAGQTYVIRTRNLSSQEPLSLSLHYLCGSATGGRDCRNILTSPGFEGTAAEVFQFWKAGPAGAYQRNAAYAHSGSFSMRLHASLGNYPCNENVLQPYLYQTITLPHGIPEGTRLTLAGRYLVTGSTLMCSNPNQPDADDILSFDLRTLTGTSVFSGTPPQPILNGGAPTGTWHYRTAPLNDYLDLQAYAGQPLNLSWNGFNDGDTNGTFFYLDDLEAQLCVPSLPIPDELVWTAPESGPYYLQVGIAPEHFVPETLYTLSISQLDPYEPDNDCATASPIAVDTEVQTHTLHLGEDTDWITFTAHAGEQFKINYSTFPMTLSVGVWVNNACTEPKAEELPLSKGPIQWVAQQDSINYIRVKATNPAEVPPDAYYTLSVQKKDPFPGDDFCDEARPIATDGQTLTTTLHELTDTDWFSFTARAGQTYRFDPGAPVSTSLSLSIHDSCDSKTDNATCQSLLANRGFEGPSTEVFNAWHAGSPGAYMRAVNWVYTGTYALRLHASLGTYPCSQSILQPYLYQVITLPDSIEPGSYLDIIGHYLVDGSNFECSTPDHPDAGDKIHVGLETITGTRLISTTADQFTIINGGIVSKTWYYIEFPFSQYFDPTAYAGQSLRAVWFGYNDGDTDGTFFYLDELDARLCKPLPQHTDPFFWTAPRDGIFYLRVAADLNTFVQSIPYALSITEQTPDSIYLPLVLRLSETQ